MTLSSCRLTGRLLLALMLLTFLSPDFGWQWAAAHDHVIPDAASVAAGSDDMHDHNHQHGKSADELSAGMQEHDHEDPHTMIGHVLGHMPANFMVAFQLHVPPHLAVQRAREPLLIIPSSPLNQPYRPPQTLFV